MTKPSPKQKLYRLFMLIGGILFVLAGFYAILKNDTITSEIVIKNFIFFLAGAALIYSGFKWTGKNN